MWRTNRCMLVATSDGRTASAEARTGETPAVLTTATTSPKPAAACANVDRFATVLIAQVQQTVLDEVRTPTAAAASLRLLCLDFPAGARLIHRMGLPPPDVGSSCCGTSSPSSVGPTQTRHDVVELDHSRHPVVTCGALGNEQRTRPDRRCVTAQKEPPPAASEGCSWPCRSPQNKSAGG